MEIALLFAFAQASACVLPIALVLAALAAIKRTGPEARSAAPNF